MTARSAVIVDAVRTPSGRRGGGLSSWHPVDLAAFVLSALEVRTGLDPSVVDDVVMGCVTQVGPQSTNIGRNAVLAAGWPETVPGTTVDRQCGSSQQALHFAVQGVLSGAYDVAVAAGVECMSTVPMFSNALEDLADLYGPQMSRRYADRVTFQDRGLIRQGMAAELVAAREGHSRDELDAFALRSQERARASARAGRFGDELLAVPTSPDTELDHDETIRDTTAELLAGLRPVFREDGLITAGNSSPITDGAAAVLVAEEAVASRLGLRPLARVAGLAVAAGDPVEMLTAPIPATEGVLRRAGLRVADIDRFEVNEAFAPVVLAWQRAVDADPDRVNVDGGAIALGHPLGASGVKLMATLVWGLVNGGGRWGLQTMCEGGGMANATVVERVA